MDWNALLAKMGPGSAADWFSGTMSALAVVAAVSGYFVTNSQRKADQRDRDQTAARLLATKIMQLASLTDDIHRPIYEALNGPELDGVWGRQKWSRIRGVTGVRDEPTLPLDAAQEDMLMRLGENKLLMDLMLEISRYRTLVQHMHDYVLRRDAFLQLTPAPVAMDGLQGAHLMGSDEVMRLLPYALTLENLIEQILEQTEENKQATLALFDPYNALVKKHFRKAKMVNLGPKRPEGELAEDTAEKTRMWKLGRKIRDALKLKFRK